VRNHIIIDFVVRFTLIQILFYIILVSGIRSSHITSVSGNGLYIIRRLATATVATSDALCIIFFGLGFGSLTSYSLICNIFWTIKMAIQ
jgi:hypothetical protein